LRAAFGGRATGLRDQSQRLSKLRDRRKRVNRLPVRSDNGG
jgi:hypothetical protein